MLALRVFECGQSTALTSRLATRVGGRHRNGLGRDADPGLVSEASEASEATAEVPRRSGAEVSFAIHRILSMITGYIQPSERNGRHLRLAPTWEVIA